MNNDGGERLHSDAHVSPQLVEEAATVKESLADPCLKDPGEDRPIELKVKEQQLLPAATTQSGALAGAESPPAPAPVAPAQQGSSSLDVGWLRGSGVLMLVLLAVSWILFWTVRPMPAGLSLTLATAMGLLYSATVWRFCTIARKRFAISELDPIKAASPLLLILLLSYSHAYADLMQLFSDPSISFGNFLAIFIDYLIIVFGMIGYAGYWMLRWPYILLKYCTAIDQHAAVLQENKVRRGGAVFGTILSNLFVFVPGVNILAMYIPMFWISSRLKKSGEKYAEIDLTQRYALQQLLRRKKIEGRSNPDEVLIRYRAFSGFEQWLKERFSDRSWKKGLLMMSFAAAFFIFNGPVFLLQGLIYLMTIIGGSGSVPQSVSAQAANTSAVGLLLNMVFYPLFAIILCYFARPTHLLLSPSGIRFLWRHGLLRTKGRVVAWNSIEEIKLTRKFGKTLSQDASLTLVGRERNLLSAKLANIASLDDKAAVLEALDKWAPRTSRSAEVTELLRPPADHSYTELWLQALTAPPKRERLKPLVAGAVLDDGKYQVQREIGSGGQGFAYLAKNLQTMETSVLKEYIMPVFVDMETRRKSLEQFEREARTLQSLDNDRVVKLIDFFLEDHRAYLVLEHIEGENLKQLVERSGPLSQSDCLKLGAQMCEILRYLHAMAPPVVHRDFTPDNLILGPDGTLKLIDFNVAQQQETSTFTGTVVGKHAYLPPEQFRGAATTRSDIYALGCCLFYLLTGQDPEPISVSHPQQQRPEVSAVLDQLVARATALDESLRYQDVDTVMQQLEETTANSL